MIGTIVKTVFGLAGKVFKFGVIVGIGAVGAIAAHDYWESRRLENGKE